MTDKKDLKKMREVVDAREDDTGNIVAVKFKGNQNFTNEAKARELIERDGGKNIHVVQRKDAKPHLRTNKDSKKKNNLDEMARRGKKK